MIKIELWKEIIIEKKTVEVENRLVVIFVRKATTETSIMKGENVRTVKGGKGGVLEKNVLTVKGVILLKIERHSGKLLRDSGKERESGKIRTVRAVSI